MSLVAAVADASACASRWLSASMSSANQTARPWLDSRTKSRSAPLAASGAEMSPTMAHFIR